MENKIIGNKIAEARKKKNLSQAQLAQRLFISPQAVGKWERGESFPDIITFNRLAKILDVDLNYFSDNIQSELTETTLDESSIKQSMELPSEKQNLPTSKTGNKLSWDMSSGNWVDADFSGLKNLQEKFSSSNMMNCKFVGSDMSGLLLKKNNVGSCDFSGSDISSSHIQSSNLSNNLFRDCSFQEAQFSGNNIEACDFSGTNFNGTVFKSGSFLKNTTTNAVWNRTSFIGMHMDEMVFEGTLENCIFEDCSFYKVAFQNSRLINTFFKNNKKLKRIRFIDCNADRMTYEFLKQGNADLSGISLLTP